MDPWTAIVAGLVVIPVLGLLAVLADLSDAYNDLIIVRAYRPPPSIEAEEAKHTLWAQVARATSLCIIALMAVFELIDVLNRNGIALLIYLLALVLVADGWRARRARKRMVAMLASEDT